jgi:hypothetical protein
MPKITKMDAFSLFQSKTSIFYDEETSSTSFTAGLKQLIKQQLSPKSTILPSKSKKRRDKQTLKIRSDQHIQNSNFRFKSRENAHEVVSGAKKIAPRSVYVDSDAVRLYRASSLRELTQSAAAAVSISRPDALL